jgi:AcrR family transcriptional regulator
MKPSDKPSSRDPGRRRRILDAAKAHFTRGGFRGTRLEAIAAEAGCAKGAVYLEFESKETLLREVVLEVLAATGARYAREVLGVASPLERLRATLRFTFREMDQEPLFERLAHEDPELEALKPIAAHADQQQQADAQIAMLRGWIDEGIAAGELRADLDREALPFVLGALRTIHMHARTATHGRIPRERLLDGVIDVFIAGIAAPPSPTRSFET